MKITLIIIVVALILYFIFNSNKKNKNSDPEYKIMIDDGIYSCETISNPGYYKLTVKEDSFNFQHIVSIHLPPSILEEVNGILSFIDSNNIKMIPSPKAINDFLTVLDKETLQIINSSDSVKLKLKKQKKTKDGE